MKRKFSFSLFALFLVLIGLFNLFVVLNDFGPKTALACNSPLCGLLYYGAERCETCYIVQGGWGWGCVLCPWDSCDPEWP